MNQSIETSKSSKGPQLWDTLKHLWKGRKHKPEIMKQEPEFFEKIEAEVLRERIQEEIVIDGITLPHHQEIHPSVSAERVKHIIYNTFSKIRKNLYNVVKERWEGRHQEGDVGIDLILHSLSPWHYLKALKSIQENISRKKYRKISNLIEDYQYDTSKTPEQTDKKDSHEPDPLRFAPYWIEELRKIVDLDTFTKEIISPLNTEQVFRDYAIGESQKLQQKKSSLDGTNNGNFFYFSISQVQGKIQDRKYKHLYAHENTQDAIETVAELKFTSLSQSEKDNLLQQYPQLLVNESFTKEYCKKTPIAQVLAAFDRLMGLKMVKKNMKHPDRMSHSKDIYDTFQNLLKLLPQGSEKNLFFQKYYPVFCKKQDWGYKDDCFKETTIESGIDLQKLKYEMQTKNDFMMNWRLELMAYAQHIYKATQDKSFSSDTEKTRKFNNLRANYNETLLKQLIQNLEEDLKVRTEEWKQKHWTNIYESIKYIGGYLIPSAPEATLLNTKTLSELAMMFVQNDPVLKESGMMTAYKNLHSKHPKVLIEALNTYYKSKTVHEFLESPLYERHKDIIKIITQAVVNNIQNFQEYWLILMEVISKSPHHIAHYQHIVSFIQKTQTLDPDLLEAYLTTSDEVKPKFFETYTTAKNAIPYQSVIAIQEKGEISFGSKEADKMIFDAVMLDVSPPSGGHAGNRERVLKHYYNHAGKTFDTSMESILHLHPEWFDNTGILKEQRDIVFETEHKLTDEDNYYAKTGEFHRNLEVLESKKSFRSVKEGFQNLVEMMKNTEMQIPRSQVTKYLQEFLEEAFFRYLESTKSDYHITGNTDKELYLNLNRKSSILFGDSLKEFLKHCYKEITGTGGNEKSFFQLIQKTVDQYYQAPERHIFLIGDNRRVENTIREMMIEHIVNTVQLQKDFDLESMFRGFKAPNGSEYNYEEMVKNIFSDAKLESKIRTAVKQKVIEEQSTDKWIEKEKMYIENISTLLANMKENTYSNHALQHRVNHIPLEKIDQIQNARKQWFDIHGKQFATQADLEKQCASLFENEVNLLDEAKKSFQKIPTKHEEVRFAHERNSNTILGGANGEICIWADEYIKMLNQNDTGFIPMNIGGINQGYTHFRISKQENKLYYVVSINAKRDATTTYGAEVFIRNITELIKKSVPENTPFEVAISVNPGTGSNNNDIIEGAREWSNGKTVTLSPVFMSSNGYQATACFVLHDSEANIHEENNQFIFTDLDTYSLYAKNINMKFGERVLHQTWLETENNFKQALGNYIDHLYETLNGKLPSSILNDEIRNIFRFSLMTKSIPEKLSIRDNLGIPVDVTYQGDFLQKYSQVS